MLSFNQYYNQVTTTGQKRWIIAVTIICFYEFVTDILSIVSQIISYGTVDYMSLIEAAVFLSGGILIGYRKIWIASLAVIAYMYYSIALWMIMLLDMVDRIGWRVIAGMAIWRIISIAVLVCVMKAAIILFKLEKGYKKYSLQAMQSWQSQGMDEDSITGRMNLAVSKMNKKRKIEKIIAVVIMVVMVAFFVLISAILWDLAHWE